MNKMTCFIFKNNVRLYLSGKKTDPLYVKKDQLHYEYTL